MCLQLTWWFSSLKATTSMHPAFLGGVWDQLFGHPKTPPDPRLQPIHGDEIDDLVNQQLAHGDNR